MQHHHMNRKGKTMKTKTSTKRMARRLAAVLSLAVTCVSQAGTFDWTGKTDNYWKTGSNWNRSGSYGSRTLPTDDDMVFKRDNFDVRFTESAVIFDGAYKNNYRTFVRNVGSASKPLVFRAVSATDGMQFSSSKNTFIADQEGSVYLRFESGKWSTAGTSSLEIGGFDCEVTLTDGAVFDVGGHALLKNGKLALENGTMNVANSGCYFGIGANVAATLELATGGTLSAGHFSNRGQGGTVLFNGGTLKAAFVNASGMMSDNAAISVKVGANGGMIDANNLDVLMTRPIEPDGTSAGGMTFKGGGSVTCRYPNTYTGTTTVEVGTTLIVKSAIAGDKLAFTIPDGLADGVYEVVRISGSNEKFAENVLDNVTQSPTARFVLNSARTGIYFHNGNVEGDGKVWTGMAGDGKLSSAENWLDGTQPAAGDVLNFSAATAVLALNADLGDVTPSTMLFGTKVVTLAEGTLNVTTLTNANKLAVAQGATLNVSGDLVVCDASGAFLHSNEGTVKVARNAVCTTPTSGATTRQYADVTATTKPIQAGGLRYDRGSGRVYWRMESNADGAGAWVVGANGFSFNNPENRYSTRFYAQQSPVTLYSSADWTIPNTGLGNTTSGDLNIEQTSSLTIDTSDYDDPENTAKKHTVTLEGRLKADGNVTITGCGTVEVATEYHSGQTMTDTTIASGKTLAVTDTATLQVNAGKKILGEGTISLAAGTTLKLMSGSDRKIPTFENLSLALPADGAATLRIDGETPVKSGDYVLFGNVTGGSAEHLTVAGTVAHHATVKVDERGLVLTVLPSGLSVIIR